MSTVWDNGWFLLSVGLVGLAVLQFVFYICQINLIAFLWSLLVWTVSGCSASCSRMCGYGESKKSMQEKQKKELLKQGYSAEQIAQDKNGNWYVKKSFEKDEAGKLWLALQALQEQLRRERRLPLIPLQPDAPKREDPYSVL